MRLIRYSLRVTGRVQGVGFRWFAQQAASLYALTGWVRNLGDGSVELEVQGKPAQLDAFLKAIWRGSRFIQVDTLDKEPLDPVEEREFRVLD